MRPDQPQRPRYSPNLAAHNPDLCKRIDNEYAHNIQRALNDRKPRRKATR